MTLAGLFTREFLLFTSVP